MSKPVVIRGIRYASLTEAARDLGMTVNAISQARKHGKLDTVGVHKQTRETKPIVIRGVKYQTMLEAAAKLSVPVDELHKARRQKTLDTFDLEAAE